MFPAKLIFACLIFFINTVSAADLSVVQNCVNQNYKNLKNRHAIVAAVLDTNSSQVSTFGAAYENQIFEIGSITKTFTSNLLAQLIIENKIKITDPIPNRYQKPGSIITFEELTTHTSGIIAGIFPDFKITNELFPFEGLTIPVFKDLYQQTPLTSNPGEQWSYSNIGISLLGLILSEEQNISYEKLIQNNILKPLNMNETYFEVPEERMKDFSQGYMTDESGELQVIPHWDLFKTAINPAGGIRSTIGDMIKYTRAHLTPGSSSLSTSILLSHRPLYLIKENNMWVGMNWIINPTTDLIWHNGQTFGFNSILAISKKYDLAIIAMTDTTVLNADGAFDTSLQDIAFSCLQ